MIGKLAAALAPLETMKSGPQPLAALSKCHRDVVTALSTDAAGETVAFSGYDGTMLARAFEGLIESDSVTGLSVHKSDYSEFLRAIADHRGFKVRQPDKPDVRVRIFGPLEARLLTIDRLVLGGLNEGTWPPEARSDPWLSRPMRRDLGLDLPERRIGLSAHDFAQMLGAGEVIITRAAKVGGAPTVDLAFHATHRRTGRRRRWNDVLRARRSLSRPGTRARPPGRSETRPPPGARRRRSRRDRAALGHRYRALAARSLHYLRQAYSRSCIRSMRSTPPPGARDRGTVIHGAIGDFTAQFAAELPADPLERADRARRKTFRAARGFSGGARVLVAALQAHRALVRRWEGERRAAIATLHGEIRGELKFRSASASSRSPRVADRIEQRSDGGYAILDYKTGAAPTEKQVRTGLAPQLTLEAAILRAGGFAGIAARLGRRNHLCHAQGRRSGRRTQERSTSRKATPDIAGRPRDGAADGAGAANSRTRRRPIVRWCIRCGQTHYGDYDHLARVKEWALSGGETKRGARSNERAARKIPDRRARVQIAAADPDVSAFVSANAGSGKTHVLAQRVINLLLRGTDPAKILCITFTKAAAANMANRVFDTLAKWTTLDDAALDKRDQARTGNASRAGAARPGAPPVRHGAGNAGRAEGADHPRLLHAAAASVSVRGQCGRALRRARRSRDARSCSNDLTLDVMLEAAAEPDSAARQRARHRDHRRPPTHLQGSDRATRSASAT